MNVKEIKQLMGLVSDHGIAEFEMEKEGVRLKIKKYSTPEAHGASHVPFITPLMPQSQQMIPQTQVTEQKEAAPNKEEDLSKVIKSPIVGTFYAAPSPDADPFVTKGSKVTTNDTVCIVEAMKVMNEIKAEISGVIEEILVENGQAVEFGQPLFKVK